MRHVLFKCLAPLASERAQDKYIVHGTKDEYYLLSELLDTAASTVAHVLSVPMARSGLSATEIEVVRKFDVVLNGEGKDLDVEAYSNSYLIHSCSEWAKIRRAANTCLVALGFDVSIWEQTDA